MSEKYQAEPVTHLARRALGALEQRRWRSQHDPELIVERTELENEQKRFAEARRNRPSFEQRVMQRFAQKRGK